MLANEYLDVSRRTDRIRWSEDGAWTIVPFGIIGEIGSLAEVVKKYRRDKKNYETYVIQVKEEIGDVIWYLFASARRAGVRDIVWPIVDGECCGSDIYNSLDKVLSGACFLYRQRDVMESGNAAAGEDFVDSLMLVLEGLSEVACSAGLSMEEIASHAVSKNEMYWGDPSASSHCFDCTPERSFPSYEQLPRKFTIRFQEVSEGRELIISMNGVQLGDRLTDNTHSISGYRYHDVFHMAAAAFLGWSPVFRRMLKRKRKSDPAVDENEDGARAAIIEEAVVSQVYRYGARYDFKPTESIDEDLIKLIMEMTTEYECKNIEGRDWKHYATESIKLFGVIKDGFTGDIEFNADDKSYKISPI